LGPAQAQAQAQLAAAMPCHHPRPPVGRNWSFPALLCIIRKKKDEKRMLQAYVLSISDVS
jgi:hypothetical protein